MDKELVKIHKYLESERDRLLKGLISITDSATITSMGNPFVNKEEVAESFAEREKSYAYIRNLKQKLDTVQRTLDKFRSGTYGLCDNCGKVIPRERLQAMPETSLCISCKGRR